jgi:hypothetical protein
VDAAVIDAQSAIVELVVDFDKAFAKTNLAPGVIFLDLDRGGNDRFHADDGSE